MPAGTSLGEGIGLQSPRRDDYWMRRIAEDNAARDAAEAKRREKEADQLVKDTDINVDLKTFLPPYAKKANEIVRNMYNELAVMRQGSKYIPESILRQKALETKQKLNDYIIGNQAAQEYIKRKDILHNADILAKLQSTDSTLEDLEVLTSSNPFLKVDRKGGFSYFGVGKDPIKFEYGKPDIIGVEKGERHGRAQYNREYFDYSDATVGKMMENLTADPNWVLQSLVRLNQEDPKNFGMAQGETTQEYILRQRSNPKFTEYVEAEARRLKPPKYYGRTMQVTDLAPGGGSQKEKWTAPVEFDVEANIVSRYEKVTNERGLVEERPIQGKAIRPIYMALNPQSKPVTLSSNKQMLDANTNKPIQGSYTFTFKPDGITVIKTNSGEWRKMVMGTVVRPVTAGDFEETVIKDDKGKDITEKTSKVLVPYDNTGISSSVESQNDLTEFNREFSGLKKDGTISPEMQTKINQFAKANGLSKAEAIRILKEKGYIK